MPVRAWLRTAPKEAGLRGVCGGLEKLKHPRIFIFTMLWFPTPAEVTLKTDRGRHIMLDAPHELRRLLTQLV